MVVLLNILHCIITLIAIGCLALCITHSIYAWNGAKDKEAKAQILSFFPGLSLVVTIGPAFFSILINSKIDTGMIGNGIVKFLEWYITYGGPVIIAVCAIGALMLSRKYKKANIGIILAAIAYMVILHIL